MPTGQWTASEIPLMAEDALRVVRVENARRRGAETDEEVNKFIQAVEKIEDYNYRNVDVTFEGTGTNKQLKVTVHMYSNRDNKESFDHVPTYEDLERSGLRVDDEGDIDYSDLIGVCERCQEQTHVDKMVHVIDADEMWCYGCAEEHAHKCDHCGNWYDSTEEFEEVYRNYDDYLGYWCRDCQSNEGAQWDDDDERMYVNPGGRMNKYYNPTGVLARGVVDCPECNDSPEGWCPRHLQQKIKEIEDEATHLWVYDTERRDYHSNEHARFKKCRYRMPHEHPYLYYGIELEVLWDQRKGSYSQVTKDFIEATGGMFVAEYDRSVDERGMQIGHCIGAEFISRPTSYKRWVDKGTVETLKKGLEVLKKYGATSPQDPGCGLHVHMSKTFFEKNTKKKVSQIKSDMDWFFQYFQPEIEKVSQREYTQYCASKAFRMKNAVNDFRNNNAMFGVKGKFQMEQGQLTVSQGSGITHHDCVIETPKTIEARTFKSTIIAEEILATIEFCRGLAHAARNRTGLMGRTFGDIMFTKDCLYLDEFVRKHKIDTSRVLKNKLEVKI